MVDTGDPVKLRTGDATRSAPSSEIPWGELLKRIYNVDALACSSCGGRLRYIALNQQPEATHKILSHLGLPTEPPRVARARDSPWPTE